MDIFEKAYTNTKESVAISLMYNSRVNKVINLNVSNASTNTFGSFVERRPFILFKNLYH